MEGPAPSPSRAAAARTMMEIATKHIPEEDVECSPPTSPAPLFAGLLGYNSDEDDEDVVSTVPLSRRGQRELIPPSVPSAWNDSDDEERDDGLSLAVGTRPHRVKFGGVRGASTCALGAAPGQVSPLGVRASRLSLPPHSDGKGPAQLPLTSPAFAGNPSGGSGDGYVGCGITGGAGGASGGPARSSTQTAVGEHPGYPLGSLAAGGQVRPASSSRPAPTSMGGSYIMPVLSPSRPSSGGCSLPTVIVHPPRPGVEVFTPVAKVPEPKDRSLGLLCENFLAEFGHGTSLELTLDVAAKKLAVERRRIYDIVNILERLDIIQRKAKNQYYWIGTERIADCLIQLKTRAVEGQRQRINAVGANPDAPCKLQVRDLVVTVLDASGEPVTVSGQNDQNSGGVPAPASSPEAAPSAGPSGESPGSASGNRTFTLEGVTCVLSPATFRAAETLVRTQAVPANHRQFVTAPVKSPPRNMARPKGQVIRTRMSPYRVDPSTLSTTPVRMSNTEKRRLAEQRQLAASSPQHPMAGSSSNTSGQRPPGQPITDPYAYLCSRPHPMANCILPQDLDFSSGPSTDAASRRERSLGALCQKFLCVFLLGQSVVCLDDAAKLLMRPDEDNGPGKLRTKIRRLYDIANVLTTLRILQKVQVADNKRPAFRWLGPSHVPLLRGQLLPSELSENLVAGPSTTGTEPSFTAAAEKPHADTRTAAASSAVPKVLGKRGRRPSTKATTGKPSSSSKPKKKPAGSSSSRKNGTPGKAKKKKKVSATAVARGASAGESDSPLLSQTPSSLGVSKLADLPLARNLVGAGPTVSVSAPIGGTPGNESP